MIPIIAINAHPDVTDVRIECVAIHDQNISKYSGETNHSVFEGASINSKTIFELSSTALKENISSFLGNINLGDDELDFLIREYKWLNEIKKIEHSIHDYVSISSVELCLFKDIDEDFEVLNIICKTDVEVEDALDTEDKFFNEVFVELYDLSDGKINFRIESNAI